MCNTALNLKTRLRGFWKIHTSATPMQRLACTHGIISVHQRHMLTGTCSMQWCTLPRFTADSFDKPRAGSDIFHCVHCCFGHCIMSFLSSTMLALVSRGLWYVCVEHSVEVVTQCFSMSESCVKTIVIIFYSLFPIG